MRPNGQGQNYIHKSYEYYVMEQCSGGGSSMRLGGGGGAEGGT